VQEAATVVNKRLGLLLLVIWHIGARNIRLTTSLFILYNNLYMKGGATNRMDAITYTSARQNLAKTMGKVCRDHAPVIVTRKSGNSVVIMSLEDYEALEETAYLLRSPKNTRRLMESIAQLENGKGTEKELVV
jgi:antitoxin YefM